MKIKEIGNKYAYFTLPKARIKNETKQKTNMGANHTRYKGQFY